MKETTISSEALLALLDEMDRTCDAVEEAERREQASDNAN